MKENGRNFGRLLFVRLFLFYLTHCSICFPSRSEKTLERMKKLRRPVAATDWPEGEGSLLIGQVASFSQAVRSLANEVTLSSKSLFDTKPN